MQIISPPGAPQGARAWAGGPAWAILEGVARTASRYLLLLGFALAALGTVGGVPPEVVQARDPLAATRSLVAALGEQGRAPAADLLEDLLAPLRIDPAPAPAPEEFEDVAPEKIAELERQVAEALVAVPEHERALLWGLVLEPELDEGRRSRLLRILDQAAPAAPLEEVVRRGRGAPAWEAAIRLGLRRQPEAAATLRDAAAAWRGWGRQYALVGLVLLGDREAIPELRDACYDDSPAVRRHAALGLGELGTEEDLPFLDLVARRRPDPVTLRAVLHAKARLFARTQGPS